MSRLFDVYEAAAYLSVKPSWVRTAVFERRFEVVKLGALVRIEKDELDRYIEANRVPQGELSPTHTTMSLDISCVPAQMMPFGNLVPAYVSDP